jgi:hypothetical protein
VPQPDVSNRSKAALFDHLVGARELQAASALAVLRLMIGS